MIFFPDFLNLELKWMRAPAGSQDAIRICRWVERLQGSEDNPKGLPVRFSSVRSVLKRERGMPFFWRFLHIPIHPETCSKDRTFVVTISGLSPGKKSGFPNHG